MQDRLYLQRIWQDLSLSQQADVEPFQPGPPIIDKNQNNNLTEPAERTEPIRPTPEPIEPVNTGLQTLPFATNFGVLQGEERHDLRAYWPVSRRFMRYAWRYLRRPVADGPQDILDIEATVKQVALEGLLLKPVYRRRLKNHARLLILLDQAGSMVPFHPYLRDLVQTVEESNLEQTELFYFYNIPAQQVYLDTYLTIPVPFKNVLDALDNETGVLIVSDAGAARGRYLEKRVLDSLTFVYRLYQRTSLIAWLNPMPRERWQNSSAEEISEEVSMFQMNPDGLSNAIDVLRGQL